MSFITLSLITIKISLPGFLQDALAVQEACGIKELNLKATTPGTLFTTTLKEIGMFARANIEV